MSCRYICLIWDEKGLESIAMGLSDEPRISSLGDCCESCKISVSRVTVQKINGEKEFAFYRSNLTKLSQQSMVFLSANVTKPIHQLTLAAGSRITIANITPAEFDDIAIALGDQRALRLTYYGEKLELRLPSEEHEVFTRMVDAMIDILCDEMAYPLKTIGSTLLKSKQGSPEADNAYYIHNEPLVRGRTINLAQDPAPDLVVEIDVTHSDINKKEMYQQMGVAEFWSYDSKQGSVRFYQLQQQRFQETLTSATFPLINRDTLKQFVEKCRTEGELPAKKWFRQWVRQWIQQHLDESSDV
jgi:Uma2 family endonuclease